MRWRKLLGCGAFAGSALLAAGAAEAAPRPGAAPDQAAAKPRFVLLSRSPRAGIRGSLRQGAARIDFASRREGGVLTSTISAADGKALWIYQEGVAWRELEGEVRIVVGDQIFDGTYSPAVRETMDRIAASAEGALLRTLALELATAAGGERLTAERRGLETAFQAMQPSYPRFTSTAETADYVISAAGGFAVKSQHHDAVFANNHFAVPLLSGEPLAKDDRHIDDDCFGMCGAGCTSSFGCGFEGWSHEWIGRRS